ncbi:RNA polymerase II transcription elongation factor SpEAF [Vermiconidia calcicola]|uniref:RNA polymerase II transcription elongation factor SpEAF n=1 Tax=Vermiconidia calcicola TaxID=1690605 RepID=A0ACC3MNP3_9PEZI|nr:RNA polymerase II transcription elongation factor SpEAF [Vermiconidia calcicola]
MTCLTQDDGTAYASKPDRPSSKPTSPAEASNTAFAPAYDATAITPTDTIARPELMSYDTKPKPIATVLDAAGDLAVRASYSHRASREPDGPVGVPDRIAPPQPDEEANFSDATQQLLDLEQTPKPAKVVRLPDENVQDEAEEERARRHDESDSIKVARTHLQAQGEAASSPSSTVGAYSAATPLPPQDSPDTSPDSETGDQIEVLRPKDMRPSPEEQRQKEEHDRLLAAQKDIARRQALGDVSTPDEQLRLEEREAAARDAEERAAREGVAATGHDIVEPSEEAEVDEIMEDVLQDQGTNRSDERVPSEDDKIVSERSTMSRRTDAPTAQEDGDNITVASRNKAALTIDTSRLQQAPAQDNHPPAPGDQERMTTRTSSGVLQKRTVSEILGQTPTQSSNPGRSVMSPDLDSPMNVRHPLDTPAPRRPSAAFETPRPPSRPPGFPSTPSNSRLALEDLMVLKGAAEDPERDYLEPLFRMQAHEPGQSRTTSLNELVRSASKSLSTEDQFTTVQERIDYRILRRIYQLQNANKWSLRQMEKRKEPEPPVTHHDHMMAEMKWMRKDFKAERKMKTSVCAWLARRCADWVGASADERKAMQIKVRPVEHKRKETKVEETEEQLPDLEQSGESAAEDEACPPTPRSRPLLSSTLIVPPELSDAVSSLQQSGKLHKALEALPVTGFSEARGRGPPVLGPVSKFVHGKVLPRAPGPPRKRSRFDYEDDGEVMEHQPDTKRSRREQDLAPDDQESALFHPDNKHIRDRLHANNAFRPPSEFIMPSTQFYEFRNGSQWIWEDDQKLRKLAKEYSFNWSLIADELQLPAHFKSSAERRTPWECFERWVDLEQLPTEMKKTMYFKTWYQRLEQSQQAAERRYQAQVAALQAQNNGQATHVPMRRRTVPTRVEKRKNTRYLWLVDAMRKLARKKEQTAYKQAEGELTSESTDSRICDADSEPTAQRAAAQRKTQTDTNQPRAPMMTPQEFSKKRYERDLQIQEAQRQHRQKMVEAQQRQMMAARAQQNAAQGMPNGGPNQQRPSSSGNAPAQQAQMQANGQQQPSMNGQMPQQGRPGIPMATRNGHLAVPQVNGQGIPQAPMRPNGPMPHAQDMQRMAHANAQARNPQYGGQQQYPIQNTANMQSPGSGGMTPQQMQNSQAMLYQQQMNNAGQAQGAQVQQAGNHQMAASPSMPPPPTPQSQVQQLSSGHTPVLMNIKQQIRAKFPHYTDEQINGMATEMLKSQSQSTNQARQSAMNAAAGINGGVAPQQQAHGSNAQAYAHNQAAAYQNASNQMPNANYVNGDVGAQQQGAAPTSTSPQQHYANVMRQRQMQQMNVRMQHSPPGGHATLANGSSPGGMATAPSPSMTPVSPNMQYSNMHTPQMAAASPAMSNIAAGIQQRPPSRGATTPGQIQRLGSSGSMAGGLPSPQGLQGSPRNMQASMAR